MDLRALIKEVEAQAGSDDPLARLEAAILQHDELTEDADRLLDHFVQAAREAGCSWAQIGGVLGVTKQAAQQRHGGAGGLMGWLRKRAGQRGLFTRFTDRARRAAAEAQNAARELGHNYVGTEHVLLGLLADDDSIAGKALAGWKITRKQVIGDIEKQIGRGEGAPAGHIPFTPRAKKVLELSLREALSLGHNYIGTEHILLGLVREQEGVGGQILIARGITIDKARTTVTDLLTGYKLGRSRDERKDG